MEYLEMNGVYLYIRRNFSSETTISIFRKRKQQRAAVKFYFLLEKLAAETIVMFKTACEDVAISKIRVYKWFSHSKNGCGLKANISQDVPQRQKVTKLQQKFVPRSHPDEQNFLNFKLSLKMILAVDDESWCCGYNPETKQQIRQ